MNIRVNGIVEESIVDGDGIRYVIFTQGCFHACRECHNPDTHSIDGGYLLDFDTVLDTISQDPLNDGVTFSGGEPMLQAKNLKILAKKIKQLGKSIFVYSGFVYEQIIENKEMFELLCECDVLIDGKFEIAKKNLLLRFRGSENQRVIDVKKSLESQKVVLLYDD